MFSKELEELIQASLVDGIITSQELAIIHKKALAEGLDLDEVDLIINSRLQKIIQKEDAQKEKLIKCPVCGEIIPPMSAVCPSCGHVIDSSLVKKNQALDEYIKKLETSLVKLKENGVEKYNEKVKAELEGMIRQGTALYGDNEKIKALIAQVETSIIKYDKRYEENRKRKRRNKLIAIGFLPALLIVHIIITGITLCTEDHNRHTAGKNAIEQSFQQRTELCEKMRALPEPNRSNYKDVEQKFMSIVWKDIDGIYMEAKDEIEENKESFIQEKRAVAKRVYIVYKDIYGEKRAEEMAPNYVKEPWLYIKN